MFLGQFQHTLDEKGRLTVPARFRELLDGGAYITQGLDQCLVVMTSPSFNHTMGNLSAMNMADPNARLLRRVILANAYSIEVDKAGRMLVPRNCANMRSWSATQSSRARATTLRSGPRVPGTSR